MSKFTDYTFDQKEIVAAFIKLIKDNREAQNLTVKELGEKAGISYTVIYDLEKRNILPKVETINKIVNALGFEIDMKTCASGSAQGFALIYYKDGYKFEKNMLTLKKNAMGDIVPTNSLEDLFNKYLIKQGLYLNDIEEVKSFIKFKLSQH